MSDKTPNERLASLEATLIFLKELLQEIRSDVKDQPTREEFSEHIADDRSAEKDISEKITNLSKKIEKYQTAQKNMVIKVGVVAGVLGMLAGALLKLIFTGSVG